MGLVALGHGRAILNTSRGRTCREFCFIQRDGLQKRSRPSIELKSMGHNAAASNRGNSLLDMGRMGEALKAHATAVERDPAHPGARYNLALTQLRMGDWESGWAGYEARWRFREVHRHPRTFSQPRWHGESLEGRRILLHAEQGLGDTIQFCRYATMVVARGGAVILQVQAPVERLMQSLPAVRAGCAETALLGEKTA